MAQADAPSRVRSRNRFSLWGGFSGNKDHDAEAEAGANERASGIVGYAKQLSHPAYERLLKSETLLKRLVPVLIVIFLAIVAAARWMSLSSQAVQIEQSATTELHFIAELIEEKMSATLAADDGAYNPHLLQNVLADNVPSRYVESGRVAILSDNSGKIVASVPYQSAINGKKLETALGDVTLLVTFGRSAQTRELDTPLRGASLAVHRNLDMPLGGITLLQPQQELFAAWKRTVSLNVSLFVGTSSILLVILYAYFAQAARAREADGIYSRTQNRFDTAMTRGRCGLWDWDLARGRIYWSSSMFSLLGYERGDALLGFSEVSELVHEEDVDLFGLANSVLKEQHNNVDRLFRMRHYDGQWVWVRVRCEIVEASNGEMHLIGIAMDVSEQERIKQESRQKDVRLHDAIENLSEAFVLWDAKRRLVMCNSKYQQLHALDTSTITAGMSYEDVMAESERPLVTNNMVSGASNGEGARTLEAELDDGRWLQINERRTKDGGYVSVGTDITALKNQETKLKDSERRLMATVSDLQDSRHKLEVQAQQLVELAEKYASEKNRAEAANKTKSEFLANISHELRTPLNAIIGFSEIMTEGLFGPLGSDKYREYSRDIHESGSYLLGVINDVLDMSKIEAGRLSLDYETFHVNEIVEETLRIIAHQSQDRNIEILDQISPKIELEADRRAIKQIMINLMSNAVKFTGNGGKINVRARQVGEALTISIEDEGIGISSEDLKKLGRPFEQVQNQFTKSHKGSGLGLAISRSLTELHGGAMKIRSKPGEGTIVSLRLPLAKPEFGDSMEPEITTEAEPA